LFADAGHNLSDVFGLILAWGASELARRPPTKRYTYGLRGSSILAALLNAIASALDGCDCGKRSDASATLAVAGSTVVLR